MMLKRHDKDGDGKLSEAEYPKDGKIPFAKADANGDGFVDGLEIAMVAGAGRGGPGEGMDVERILKSFKESDANGDGRVSREEWKGRPELFDRLDGNKDGSVSKAEALEKFRAAMGGKGRAGEALFRRNDRNGDGKITKEEWKIPPEAFDRYDANRDGAITPDEMIAKGPREGTRGPGEDAAGFFAKADRNHDGRLTKEEFPNERKFAEMDADGNGEVTPAEVEEVLERRKAESAYGFLEKYDLNGDGKVTRDEFTGPAAEFEAKDRNHDGVIDAGE